MATEVAVALPAGPVEDSLARRFERVQLGIGIGQGNGPGGHRVGRIWTLGEENWVLWKPATSSRKLTGGSTVTDA
jgi:hypothetical protein